MTRYRVSDRRVVAVVVCLTLCWAEYGCGSGDGPKLGTVSGKVTLDGQPLAGVLVTFMPEKGRSSSGRTGQDGTYELMYTFDQRGAEVGKHIVRVTTAASENAESAVVQEKLPARYHRDTELKAEVKSGRNEFNFDLTSQGGPAAPQRAPARSRPTS